jgi:hypothetical protein
MLVPEVFVEAHALLRASLGAPVVRASGSGKVLIEASSSGTCVVLVGLVSSVWLVRSTSVFSSSWSRGERREMEVALLSMAHEAATDAC